MLKNSFIQNTLSEVSVMDGNGTYDTQNIYTHDSIGYFTYEG